MRGRPPPQPLRPPPRPLPELRKRLLRLAELRVERERFPILVPRQILPSLLLVHHAEPPVRGRRARRVLAWRGGEELLQRLLGAIETLARERAGAADLITRVQFLGPGRKNAVEDGERLFVPLAAREEQRERVPRAQALGEGGHRGAVLALRPREILLVPGDRGELERSAQQVALADLRGLFPGLLDASAHEPRRLQVIRDQVLARVEVAGVERDRALELRLGLTR